MTYAPARLLALRAFLEPRTGLAPGNLGIVGDTAHAQRGTSYHLGESQLRLDAYSRQTTRDRRGLTDAASALDIGNHPDLRRLSVDLVRACRANAPGTIDIREVIYSPDGQRVLRWDRERGYSSAPRIGEADDSHLWHTHISWYRDSEWIDKVGVFAPLYGEGDMPAVRATPIGTTYAYIVRITEPAVTYGPLEGQRGTVGPKADGTPSVRNALGVYGLDGLDGRRVFLLPSREFVGEDDVIATRNERDTPAEDPAHTVAILVDGQAVWTGEV